MLIQNPIAEKSFSELCALPFLKISLAPICCIEAKVISGIE
jgi:hypothetical protein